MWEGVRVSLLGKTEVNAGVFLIRKVGVNMWLGREGVNVWHIGGGE